MWNQEPAASHRLGFLALDFLNRLALIKFIIVAS